VTGTGPKAFNPNGNLDALKRVDIQLISDAA
jgi:hypothetical protein